MDLCEDCGKRPGVHTLQCPRALRVMQAMSRRLREAEKS